MLHCIYPFRLSGGYLPKPLQLPAIDPGNPGRAISTGIESVRFAGFTEPCHTQSQVADRFWSKVRQSGNCWTWAAAIDKKDGYGRFGVGRRVVLAHRWAYEYLIGEIPEGLTLDHLCRNRACVNPLHLEPVPGTVNTQRGGQALKTHCPAGHEYTPENTYCRPGGRERQCLTCRNKRNSARRRTVVAGA